MMLNWIGYIASLIVLISLLMRSIKKLRWINLFGALIFGIYGFLIGSIPTGVMNIGIALIDIYFLVELYKKKDYFRMIQADNDHTFLKEFYSFYEKDIKTFASIDIDAILKAPLTFYILRNMTPAGLFVCQEKDPETVEIILDYVIPTYRDFQIGKYIYNIQKNVFKKTNYKTFFVNTDNKIHQAYLKKMGFTQTSEGFIKTI